MRIALLSDLHVEFDDYVPKINLDADLCVLAGDIHCHTHSADVAIDINRRYGIPVVLVAGNHEHYGAELTSSIDQLRLSCGRNKNVHFLENDTAIINGTRFLGCTLWTNFSVFGTHLARKFMRRTSHFIQDFSTIRYRGERFDPKHSVELFNQSYRWLDETMSKPFDGRTVVITHFSPHKICIHPKYLEHGMDELTPYFTTDCSPLMKKHVPDFWFYGHTEGIHMKTNQKQAFSNRKLFISNELHFLHSKPNNTSTVHR